MTLIEELERLRDAATPEPWEAHKGIDDDAPSVWDITSRHNHTDHGQTPKGWFLATVHEVVSEEGAAIDAALIVTLRNNLNTIIAALKATHREAAFEAGREAERRTPPTEAMWGGLARDIMMSFDLNAKTPRAIFKHLKNVGREIPAWLREEPEMKALDHVPSKGTRCVIIYRAMQEAAIENKEHRNDTD